MEADWDLLAVVRGCTSSSSSSSTTAAISTGGYTVADLQQNLPTPPPAESYYGGSSSGCEDLQDLYKSFFPDLKYPISTSPSAGGFINEQLKLQQRASQHQIMFQQQNPQQVKESQLIFGSSTSTRVSAGTSIITTQSQRNSVLCTPTTSTVTTSQTHQKAKKRKNLQKKVCHVPAEGLSSDMWAWRKYGQKPIKGSPYPRGYYRCSSSKGCLARKQVERNRSNPKMFIVAYTAEHNHPMPTHRNSLAGSTRQKPVTASGDAAATASPSTDNDHPAGPSSPVESPSTEKADIKTEHEEEEKEFDDMVLSDDFFVGFEELDDTDSDFFSDQIQGSVEVDFPWLSNCSSSSSTAAAAGWR